MKEILKLTLSLTLICAIAGAALAYVSTKTQSAREEAATRQRNEKMELLLPSETGAVREAGKAVSEDGTEVVFFAADDASGKTIAYCASLRIQAASAAKSRCSWVLTRTAQYVESSSPKTPRLPALAPMW